MIYGIKWHSKGLYQVTGGGKMPEWSAPLSDSTQVGGVFSFNRVLDNVVLKVQKKYPGAAGYFFRMPDTANIKSAIEIDVYPKLNSYYAHQNLCFERYTGTEIKRDAYYSASFAESGTGLKLRRMNYDIHVGLILIGLTTIFMNKNISCPS